MAMKSSPVKGRVQRVLGPTYSNPLLLHSPMFKEPLSTMRKGTGRSLTSRSPRRESTNSTEERAPQSLNASYTPPSELLDYSLQTSGDSFTDDTEDELDDFIVSDSVSEEELYYGISPSKRKESQASPRKIRRMIVMDSEDEATDADERHEPGRSLHLNVNELSLGHDCGSDDNLAKEGFKEKRTRLTMMADDLLGSQELLTSDPRMLQNQPYATATGFSGSPLVVELSPNAKILSPSCQPDQENVQAQPKRDVLNDQCESATDLSPSPRKVSVPDSDDEGFSGATPPPISKGRKPSKSPVKRREDPAKQQKAAFKAQKHKIAAEFILELDKVVTGGRVSSLADSTGGIRIIWNKKLNSTAGRANWKREAKKTDSQGDQGLPASTMLYHHHASIELAEKVIDDEDRLRNVLAHEFCHLANFMISNVKNNPHGKEFKHWAQKTTTLFKHLNILVTTKHNYDIAYKYVWSCQSCSQLYQRHSRSIDPSRHTCSACRSGKLLQIRPRPRGANDRGVLEEQKASTSNRETNGNGNARDAGKGEYQAFIKANFKPTREKLVAVATAAAALTTDGKQECCKGAIISMGAVMGALAREYRVQKAMQEAAKAASATIATDGSREARDPLSNVPTAVIERPALASASAPSGETNSNLTELFLPNSSDEEEAESREGKAGRHGEKQAVPSIKGCDLQGVAENMEKLYLSI